MVRLRPRNAIQFGLASAAALVSMLPTAPLVAKEFERTQIAQLAATDRAPRTSTPCIDRTKVRGSVDFTLTTDEKADWSGWR
ncbi:MAG: hypothetical protein WA948_06050 [Pontixanthobacter sp.]